MPSTTNFSWTTPADTDYVKDGASAIRTLANGIDTSMAQLKGGTTGQILSKTNGTDMAFTWINNDQGDLTAITAGTGISVTNGTGPIPTVAIDTATTVDLSTAQTLTNKKLSDSTTSIVDVTDNTKAVKFDVTGTTGITGTITTAFTTAKTLTLPDATDTLVGKATTDTLTNKTISASSNTLTGVINNTLTTTTGDLIYASSANTPARLGIGTSGQVLTVSGGIPAWGTAGGGDWIRISTATWTSAGAQSLTSVFSSTYVNYAIVFDNMQADSANDLCIRMRSGSTNDTSTVYYSGMLGIQSNATTSNGASNNGTDTFRLVGVNNSPHKSGGIIFIYNPYQAVRTSFTSQFMGTDGTNFAFRTGGGVHSANTSYDGLGFFLYGGGSVAGTVTVYGLKQ
jgi:hypothetical protein